MAASAAERAVLVGRARRAGGGGQGAEGGQPTGGGDGMGLTPRCPQEEEFRWLLHAEVHAVLRQLQDILKVTHPPVPPGLPSFLSTGFCQSHTADAERGPCKYPLLRVQFRRRHGGM